MKYFDYDRVQEIEDIRAQMSNEICGISVISSPLIPPRQPILELRSDVPCTEEFRSSFNKWLLDTFGETSYVYMIGDRILLNPQHLVMLRNSI